MTAKIVADALEEQKRAYIKATGHDVPADVAQMTARAFDIIDTMITRPAAEKDALKVASVFILAPADIVDRSPERLAQKYNAQVGDVVNDMITFPLTMTATRDLYQTGMAVAVALSETSVAKIKSGTFTHRPLKDVKLEAETALAFRAGINIESGAPQLETLFTQSMQTVIRVIDDATPATPRATPAPR